MVTAARKKHLCSRTDPYNVATVNGKGESQTETSSHTSLKTELSWSMAGAMERRALSSSINPVCDNAPTALQTQHNNISFSLCILLAKPHTISFTQHPRNRFSHDSCELSYHQVTDEVVHHFSHQIFHRMPAYP